jgi:hypothetical protein
MIETHNVVFKITVLETVIFCNEYLDIRASLVYKIDEMRLVN